MIKLGPEHAKTKKLIASCAASGVGIEGLEDAPSFRFIPIDQGARPLDNRGPSARGSIACGKPKPKNIRTWNPVRLSLDPQYGVRMAGDDPDLTLCRLSYHRGDPAPLREYLAKAYPESAHHDW